MKDLRRAEFASVTNPAGRHGREAALEDVGSELRLSIGVPWLAERSSVCLY